MQQPIDLPVLYEDRQLLAVNKPQGLVVEYEPHLNYSLESLALRYVRSKDKYPHKCFIGLPHRLDRPVSGVVLLAKKKSILKLLVDTFAKREIEKLYLAIVEREPAQPEATLVNWLVKDTAKRKAIIHQSEVRDSMRVELQYRYIGNTAQGYLLLVKLITGKFHQIRAQLSYMGCPIVGDAHYGAQRQYKENAICLHAYRLHLLHPDTRQPLQITAPVPDDETWDAFTSLITDIDKLHPEQIKP